MEALYLLIPLSIVLVFLAICLFLAAADGGQFDDLIGPALRILHDDDRPASPVAGSGQPNSVELTQIKD